MPAAVFERQFQEAKHPKLQLKNPPFAYRFQPPRQLRTAPSTGLRTAPSNRFGGSIEVAQCPMDNAQCSMAPSSEQNHMRSNDPLGLGIGHWALSIGHCHTGSKGRAVGNRPPPCPEPVEGVRRTSGNLRYVASAAPGGGASSHGIVSRRASQDALSEGEAESR